MQLCEQPRSFQALLDSGDKARCLAACATVMSSLWASSAGIAANATATTEAPLIPLTGLTQVLLIALLAAPIWLFGLLTGLLLPKGFTESRAASVATEIASSISSIGSDAAAYGARGGPSSRPLSDDEIAASSDADEDWEEADDAAPAAATSIASAALLSPANGETVKPVTAAGAAAAAAAAAGSTVRHTVAWAQQLLTLGASADQQLQQQDAGENKAATRPSGAAADAPAGPLSPFAAVNSTTSTSAHPSASHLANSLHALAPARGHNAPNTPPSAAVAGARGRASFAAAPAGIAAASSQWSTGTDNSHVWYVGLPDLAKFTATVGPLQDRLLSGKLGEGWSMVM
jgi:hypothetical protein